MHLLSLWKYLLNKLLHCEELFSAIWQWLKISFKGHIFRVTNINIYEDLQYICNQDVISCLNDSFRGTHFQSCTSQVLRCTQSSLQLIPLGKAWKVFISTLFCILIFGKIQIFHKQLRFMECFFLSIGEPYIWKAAESVYKGRTNFCIQKVSRFVEYPHPPIWGRKCFKLFFKFYVLAFTLRF